MPEHLPNIERSFILFRDLDTDSNGLGGPEVPFSLSSKARSTAWSLRSTVRILR
jgi:hypothetical protein